MQKTLDNILPLLKQGPASSAEIASNLGVNQTTVSRQLNKVAERVIKFGRGRATRWLVRRYLPMLEDNQVFPIYRVQQSGEAQQIAKLHIVYPENSYLVEYFRPQEGAGEVTSEWTYYESLPWWLTDMRPQGFLGRSFAQQLRDRGVPVDADPRTWSGDTVLSVLIKFPQEHIGNLLVGDSAYARWLEAPSRRELSDDEAGLRANAIALGEHFDSSAQGEQPKFSATLAEGQCIVKFSGQVVRSDDNSVANRWSDLLHSEAIASQVLNNHMAGLAAESRSFTSQQRTLLASIRFDREGDRGRVGIISFAALEAEFIGKPNEVWPSVADALHQESIITERAMKRAKLAWAFGQLIANSDMHLGNLSVTNVDGRPYELAPIYDMLPMRYAPKSAGDLPSQPHDIKGAAILSRTYWETAYPIAAEFWQRLLESNQVSGHFKALAKVQLGKVIEFKQVIDRMA